MALISRLQTSLGRALRVRRHIHAAVKYQSFSRWANIARTEYERLRKVERVKGKPYILTIDPLNTCQLRCPLCPTGAGNLPLPGGKMRLEQFQGFIDQIAPHTLKINFYNWGEPFIHRDILPMIAYSHSKRIGTAVSSNLNALPPGGGEAVVRSGLDDLIVSCDGLTQETYVRYRKAGELEKVVANLKDISEWKTKLKSKTPYIEFQFLVFRHNEHEIGQVPEFARNLGANYTRLISPFIDLTDEDIQPSTDLRFVKEIYQKEGAKERVDIFVKGADQEQAVRENPPPLECFWPWRSMVVNWNGQVDPCCFSNFLVPFGNVFEEPFEAIWNGPHYLAARRWIAGRPDPADEQHIVCKGCAGYT